MTKTWQTKKVDTSRLENGRQQEIQKYKGTGYKGFSLVECDLEDGLGGDRETVSSGTVSYTHLDVYKRQVYDQCLTD